MIKYIYRRAFTVLKSFPVKLWGLSLLNILLISIIYVLGVNIPIISIPLAVTLQAGASILYLDAYRGEAVASQRLFSGFKRLKHTAGGMCWRLLWLLIWSLIPIAGIVIVIVKSLEYSFTPYILIDKPSLGAMEALEKSKQDTKGYKANMFLAIIGPTIAYVIVSAILFLLAIIPFVGALFAFISFIVSLIYVLFAPMFLGLIRAGFYEYAQTPAPVYSAPLHQPSAGTTTYRSQTGTAPRTESADAHGMKFCTTCGTENPDGTAFCKRCGAKL